MVSFDQQVQQISASVSGGKKDGPNRSILSTSEVENSTQLNSFTAWWLIY